MKDAPENNAAGHRVEIENGPAFDVPADDVLLRAALRAGIAFPYECQVGGCGACRFEVLQGEVESAWEDAPGLSPRDRQRGKRLACQSRPLNDCKIRVRLGSQEQPTAPLPQRMQLTLIGRRQITPELFELSFEAPSSRAYLPGQYALLYPEGVAGPRAYSMTQVYADDAMWRFIVRQNAVGTGSHAVCSVLQVGQSIAMDGPLGHAYLHPTHRDVVCVAGGSGLGPMLSIARGVLAEPGTRRVHFFLGLRHEGELAAAAELATLGSPERISSTVVLSNPEHAQQWHGAVGFVHTALEHTLPKPLHAFDYYFAGPPPMIEALQDTLMIQHRVPFDHIHFDRYV